MVVGYGSSDHIYRESEREREWNRGVKGTIRKRKTNWESTSELRTLQSGLEVVVLSLLKLGG